MLWWDDKFPEIASTAGIGIDMYERFVDDSNLVSEVIEPGWRFSKDTRKLNFEEDWVPQDRTMDDDKRTALVIKEVANSVHPMIQMEEDDPSNHDDGNIPILDLKCWLEEEGKIRFQHYAKWPANLSCQLVQPCQPNKRKIFTSMNVLED